MAHLLCVGLYREEAEMRAKQTNQKYDEAEQKSQAWMKAKDEAQSHKRMWHSYWQQAMVSLSSHVPLVFLQRSVPWLI